MNDQLIEARQLIAHASEYAISALGNDWHERATALLALRAPAISETGWQPIETAPEGELVVVFWLDPNAAVELECYDFDMLEDGSWRQWTDHYEWAHSVAPVTEVPCTMPREHPPYTHWKRLGTPTGPAPAISESDLLALLPGTTYMDEPDGGSTSLLEQLQHMAKDAARYRRLRDKHDGDGPAAAVRCLTGPFFNAAIHGERLDAAIDGARAGEKS
ncbi:hypothetical protein [Burkholderia gladioli]|uniref:hypothetical protein n=1 Tax=Burkholderia gladioli TaxID=28095 RepID=UPI00163EB6E3|nr:hypothetical protein [Burkholderia gladioli]